MAEITYRDALTKGLKEAMDSDDRVFIMGEDIGAYGGAYAVTKGFLEQYGTKRIIDTPISESGFTGTGIGAAMAGLKPVVEMMTINFSLLALDQIVNHAAKIRYMSAGQFTVPLIIRAVTGGGAGLAATHSQNFENWYASVPGMTVAAPATAYDALGLLREAFRTWHRSRSHRPTFSTTPRHGNDIHICTEHRKSGSGRRNLANRRA